MMPSSKSMSRSRKKILITTGDRDGIGLEVTAKALASLRTSGVFQFFVFIDPRDLESVWARKIIKDHKPEQVSEDMLRDKVVKSRVVLVLSKSSPPLWVESATKLLIEKWADGLVTGPLSKPLIKKSGLKDLGHTDILKRLTNTKHVNMGFAGAKFNVVLATGHIGLAEVASKLNLDVLENALKNAQKLRSLLHPRLQSKPICVLGLNPHAGDDGLIGSEEDFWIKEAVRKANKALTKIEGPMVPDAAFKKQNWKKYSVFVCMYHDQGLIPFKAIHGAERGCHITLGLPVRRTSVDHGTAKDIFKKNLANPGSMKDAIKFMISWIQQES
jgi:4-hydroxythreonine-4-phosphate dehydrogenase